MRKNVLPRGVLWGKENPQWKGNKAGYFAIHNWLRRNFGEAKQCEFCKSKKWIQWANISKSYQRDIKDWKALCVVCHRRFDGITKLSKEQAKEIKDRLFNGEIQMKLAAEFGVDQSTISNVKRGLIKYYV